ncbi:serine protease persephone-like [Zeugodacus cucurbitae]|uniref:serine protease persephone-like n=1 Tax=Zeugodacus cucurbitae TaxID=28588 RepID=UPI0023D92F83|nr:serine protease persephone-like [Zeugodacus cucurbitae]XP_054088631.1 serine protease persephone-like [Zeugodacus cucurbitae]
MENKLYYKILFGLFFALFQTYSVEGADSDHSADDGSLTIFVDAGKDIESFLTLAKSIERKQSLIDDALKRMSAKIGALEERISRMATEAKATEERWAQRLTEGIKTAEGRMPAEFQRLNQKVVGLSNQLAKSRDIATPQKRPAELACDKITNDLRSIGETTFDGMPYSALRLYCSDNQPKFCRGALIDKRFLITAASCVSTDKYAKVEVDSVMRGVKAIHIHSNYSSKTASLNNIALIELESDVGYTPERYPVCLYTSQVNPESDLMGIYGKVQIVTDAECFNKIGTHLKISQICLKNLQFGLTFSGWPIYEVQENFPKFKLFAIVANETKSDHFEPYVITKVFDHLNFIESIVWPKRGK